MSRRRRPPPFRLIKFTPRPQPGRVHTADGILIVQAVAQLERECSQALRSVKNILAGVLEGLDAELKGGA